MKTCRQFPVLLLCLASLAVTGARAQDDEEVTVAALRRIGYLPQDKADLRPEDKVDMKRRNPFAERKKVTAPTRPTETVETEESRLRAFFDRHEIAGVSKFGDKYTAIMGRLTFEAGLTLPPIIPGQTQILRVMSVTDKMVEIGWVEDGGAAGYDTATPRKIQKRIKLSPQVDMKLASDEAAGGGSGWYTVDDKGRTVVPKRNLVPDASTILENMPPRSDTVPDPTITEQRNGNEAPNEVPAPFPPSAPRLPDATEPPPSPEDAVLPDPDLVPRPPSEAAPRPTPRK